MHFRQFGDRPSFVDKRTWLVRRHSAMKTREPQLPPHSFLLREETTKPLALYP
jgi:hypothetical protein